MEQQPDHESLERLIRISRTSLETAMNTNVGSFNVEALMVSFLEDEDPLHTLAWEGIAPGRSWDFEIPSDYVGDEQVKIGVSYSVIVPNPRVIRDMVI